MQLRRVHTVNSSLATFPLASLSAKSLQSILFLLVAFSCEALHSQQITDSTSSPLPGIPNPFRQNSQAIETTAKNEPVDVIQLSSLPTHAEPPVVTAISVSPNGLFLAAAGDDHAIRIVELATGKTTATLIGHVDWVQCVEFSPSGQQLASCGNDGALCLWSISPKPELTSKKLAEHALMTLAFVSNESIYTAGFSNKIYRSDESARELVVVQECDCRDIRSIVVSPDQTRIAFGGRDGILRVSDVNADKGSHQGEIVEQLHFDRIRMLQFSADGNQITSVGEDRRIVHYDLVNRKTLGQTEIGGGKLFGLCQLEPHLFAIASSDNTIRIFSDSDQQVHSKLVGHDGSVCILKRTPKHLISGSFDTTIRIWDIDKAIASIDTQGRYVHPVAAQFEDSGVANEVK